ncbi:MAG: TIGR04086 family membrane protein [Firmicutes bacterium]|nr:TIGR04086 family membrane protein [Bacillota bacterium]
MGAGSLRRESDRAQIPLWKLVAFGTGVSFLCTIVLSVLGGIIVSVFTFRPETVTTAIPMIGYVSAGIGGLWVGRRVGERGVRNGFLVGLVYLVLLLAVSAAVVREPMSAASVAVRGVSTLIVSSLGGIIGVNA